MAEQDPKGPSPLRWVTGCCAVLFFLCLGAGAVVYWWHEGTIRQFDSLVNRHLQAMAKGDWGRAYQLMALDYRGKTTLEQFQQQWKDHEYLRMEPSFETDSLRPKPEGRGWVLAGWLSFHKPGRAGALYSVEFGGTPEADRILGFEWSKK